MVSAVALAAFEAVAGGVLLKMQPHVTMTDIRARHMIITGQYSERIYNEVMSAIIKLMVQPLVFMMLAFSIKWGSVYYP